MKTDRSGRTFEEYRQLYWDGQKRIDELEEGIRIVVSKYDNDITTAADMADELEALLPEKDDGS